MKPIKGKKIQWVKVEWSKSDQRNRIWERFKIISINEGKTVQKLLGEIVRNYVGKYYE